MFKKINKVYVLMRQVERERERLMMKVDDELM